MCRPSLAGTGAGQLLELHRGQGKEIHWRDSVQCPTEDEYMDMIKQSRPTPPLCADPTHSQL